MVSQIDLRFTNPEEGGLEVVVAPVMRHLTGSFLGLPWRFLGRLSRYA